MTLRVPLKARSLDADAEKPSVPPPSPVQGDAGEEKSLESLWAIRISPALLDESLPTALYHQIYLVLRGIIGQGGFEPETLLPGEQSLARLFAVSRITVKRALNELAADKLVSRHRGRGTIITGRPSIPVVRSSFDDLLESLHQMGLVTEVELLEAAEVVAGEAGVAAQMDLAPDARLQRAVRRRLLEGEPLSYLVSYTPRAIAAHYSEEDLAHTPFLTLLERAGAAALEAEQWITAVAAEPQVASALGVSPSAPLLKIERVMRSRGGQAVQLIHGFYRPDRFQYHVRSYRPRSRGAPA